MGKRNKEVFEIVANMKVPVIAGYDNQSEVPKESFVGYHKCQECKSSVVVNCLEAPACPVCAGALENMSEDTNVVLSNTDFLKLKTLCSCDSCGTTWKGKKETLASLDGHLLHCPACTQPMTVKADDSSDSKDSDKSNTDDSNKTTDSSDTTMTTDTTEADKELDEALKNLGLKDSKDDNKDDKTETNSSDDPDEDEEDDSGEKDNEDDSDDEVDASALIYAMALKDAKDIAVVSTKNYSNWFMFNGKTPIAVAEFEKAQASVQSIFRSNDYVVALESAINNDGGINDELMKDFGFEPVKIDLNVDSLQKKIIEEEVANKTKEANSKVESLSAFYDQAVGIAAVGITKGLYDEGEEFRTALIAGLTSNNVRDPEAFVDDFLSKNLPNLMKNTISLAKELMEKPPEALSEVASMVVSSKPRTVSLNKAKTATVPAIAIHSSDESDDNGAGKQEKHNLKRERVSASEKEAAQTVSVLFSHVKTRVNH